jgi:choline-sulfatase
MSRATPPNILLVMADQLAASWLPAYGHSVVQAPSLTALAAGGVTFEAAYCASPLCAPSRASLLTGLLPSRTGVFDNASEMPASTPTAVHRLRAAGYATTLVGKMHFVGPDQLHGFEERLTPDIYPAGLEWTPDWRLPAGEQLSWYHTMDSVLEPAVVPASMQVDYDDEVAFHATRALFDHARHRRGDPLLLVASFTNPHDPWELPRAWWDRYDPDAIEPPAVAPIPLEQADPHSRRLREMCGVDDAALTVEQVRRARHGYFAAISYVDGRIGQVLAALRESGLEERTIVLFTSDHGEMLGERGLWYKMAFFEHAARVPLIVRMPGSPGRAGARVAEPVSQLDVAPTLLELAGVPAGEEAAGADGTSLAPLIGGDAQRGPQPVVAEYLAEGTTAPAVMIRHGSHKHVVCPGDPDLLFDLGADPHERHDVAATPQGAEPRARLRAEVDARWDLAELERRVLASQRDRRVVIAGLSQGRYQPWDHQPRADGARRYVRSGSDLYEQQRRARLGQPFPHD